MKFKRLLSLSDIGSSAFIFGPRMTGKTTIIRELPCRTFYNLLDPETEQKYRMRPGLFWQEISVLKEGNRIIVDEIQKVPDLLNYVQMGIDQRNFEFILSGSSARKLRRGGANLLGGRALHLKLHPLTRKEIGDRFSMEEALRFGTLPKIAVLLAEKKIELATNHLRSYITTYIKEEIQAEALTRNVGSFQRFLSIAAQSNAHTIEFANIARESSVPASTVKEYYQILEDTMIGFFLWPYDHNERRKARPKFYFFDCGVIRALQNRLLDPPTPEETGLLFEMWLINELIALNEYHAKAHEFSFWREKNHEIDIIISRGGKGIFAIECKSGKKGMAADTIAAFKSRFPGVPLVQASLNDDKPRIAGADLEVLPWQVVIDRYVNT